MDSRFHNEGWYDKNCSILGNIPTTPTCLLGDKGIGKIASSIGKPVMTDECTDNELGVSYARVMIKVDIIIKLTESITIRRLTRTNIKQSVEYEWKPPFCKKCNKVGHQCKDIK